MTSDARTMSEWVQLVKSEYLEVPGLHLTKLQVRRLWGLDPCTCDALLDELVAAQFLRRTARDGYVLVDGGR